MSNFKKRFVIIKTIIVLIAPIIVGLFPTERAFACSCVVPGTPEEEFKKFDAVFMGTVTSISERLAPDYLSKIDKAFYPKVKIGINVGKSWKGVTTDFIYVYQVMDTEIVATKARALRHIYSMRTVQLMI